MVDEVKIGSLCIVDLKPRVLTNEEHLNFLDIGAAVGNLICERNERKERIIKTCKDSVRMTVDMMADFRVDLLTVHNSARTLLRNAEFGEKIDKSEVIRTTLKVTTEIESGMGIGTGRKKSEFPNLVNTENTDNQNEISVKNKYDTLPIENHDGTRKGEIHNEKSPKLNKNERRRKSKDLLDGEKREESNSNKEIQSRFLLNEINNKQDKKISSLGVGESISEKEAQRKKEIHRVENIEKITTFHALKNLECQVGRLRLILENNMCLGGLVAAKAEGGNLQYASFSTCNVLKTVRGESFECAFLFIFH